MIYFSTYKPREKKTSEELDFEFNEAKEDFLMKLQSIEKGEYVKK